MEGESASVLLGNAAIKRRKFLKLDLPSNLF